VLPAAAGAAVVVGSGLPLAVAGALCFAALIAAARGRWTPPGRFGAANGVTAARLLGVLALAVLPLSDPAVAVVGLLALLADGLDGRLARRRGLTSEFGAYFDKETDAFFLFTLCVLAVTHNLLGGWVLLLGLLRYVFVLVLYALQPGVEKEYRSAMARYVFVGVMLALFSVFLAPPVVYRAGTLHCRRPPSMPRSRP
jgi:phosphatidylglycerophosphate synthase